MISSKGTFLKFYVDEKRQHLNVPTHIQDSFRERKSFSKKEKVKPSQLKLNLNKLNIDSTEQMTDGGAFLT